MLQEMENSTEIERLQAECVSSAKALDSAFKDVSDDHFSSIYILKHYANCLSETSESVRNLIQYHNDQLLVEVKH
jgi:hypothetical protein